MIFYLSVCRNNLKNFVEFCLDYLQVQIKFCALKVALTASPEEETNYYYCFILHSISIPRHSLVLFTAQHVINNLTYLQVDAAS